VSSDWETLFLDKNHLAAVLHHPVGPVRGVIVHVPAFAEEMNKSRRMVTLTARALAKAGWAVLVLDLYGSGDSAGDFSQATWVRWQADVAHACDELRTRFAAPVWLWGLRSGCLLISSILAATPAPECLAGVVYWQPVLKGQAFLQQFLRLKLAAASLSQAESAGTKRGTDSLVAELQQGQALEVAGYTLPPALALPLATTELLPAPLGMMTYLIGVVPPADSAPELPPALARWVAACQKQAYLVDARVVAGASFWQTQEIEVLPQLIDSTQEVLCGDSGS
jgi:exosortase A-associated hydrolase 2